jgi:holo-[acyl-carrier-protein] synthase
MAVLSGIDIIEIERVRNSLETCGDSFRDRVFTTNEINYCEGKKVVKFESYAARFAAKEAVSKAFGTGIGEGLKWKDIEIQNDTLGRPVVILTGKAEELYKKMDAKCISISLSHCKAYAVASVVIEV